MLKFIDISLLILGVLCLFIGEKIIASHDSTWYFGIPLCIISIVIMKISVRSLKGKKKIG